ncbi:DUF302 domain-containing protein [Bacteroidota bacterium]
MLIKELQSPHDFEKTVEILINRINNKEGWKVTALIDQNKAIQDNGGAAVGKFKIIKYCNGKHASQMLLSDDRKFMGTMMPKSFAVYEKADGKSYISMINGTEMGKLFGGEVEKIINEVSVDVREMISFL